jgi:hypothetical protein
MHIKKQLLVAGAIASVGAAGLAGNQLAMAKSNPQSNPLAAKIAQKFNLNQSDVQDVFDEERQAMETKHEARIEQKLSQAVTDGKLTADQKSTIIAKLKAMNTEMVANHETMKYKTSIERKAQREAKRTELQQWAKDNNIPAGCLHFVYGGSGGHDRLGGSESE